MYKSALALLTLLSAPAGAATLQWTLPTTWTDGSPLAASDIAGVNVYCGAPGAYDSFRSAVGPATQLTFDAGAASVCAATVVARMAGSGELRESGYSAEVHVNAPRPATISSVSVLSTPAALCTVNTTCKLTGSH